VKVNGGQIAALALIVGSFGLIVYQATRDESSVTFFTPEEVYASPMDFEGRLFRVSGLVLGGTKQWNADLPELRFRMTDLKGHEFKVVYNQPPPDLFKEGQGVIVEGRLVSPDLKEDGTILATKLMVKHSEVYDTQQDHSKLREAKLLDAIHIEEKTVGN
jgi:cytochrome c-type biogenesis protein CcmE